MSAIVIGTGFSGLCMGIKLREAGIHDFVILEKAAAVGGVWRENTYPGAACDVPAELYSFSFARKTDWTRRYPPQPEIQSYMQDCAQRFELMPHIRFNTEVESASYDETAGLWTVLTADGQCLKSHYFICGVGQLSRPAVPHLPGIETFSGTYFHSAQWPADFRADGKRIAVIGTGASAIQFIPELAKSAAQLDVYQRTPPYVLPKPDKAYTEKDHWMLENVPGYHEMNRRFWWRMGESNTGIFNRGSRLAQVFTKATLAHMRHHVKDPVLREKLTPDYPIGCKRVLFSSNYFPALAQPNVDIITDSITTIDAQSIHAADGLRREYDAIILGTGFRATEFLTPMQVTGGQGQALQSAWADGAEAYKGVTIAGFPNMFLLYGPNTNLGSNSIIFMIECQVDYILQAIAELSQRKAKALEVKAEVMQHYNQDVQRKLKDSVWSSGCSSWYHNDAGKVTNNWPGFTKEYKQLLQDFDAENYRWYPA